MFRKMKLGTPEKEINEKLKTKIDRYKRQLQLEMEWIQGKLSGGCDYKFVSRNYIDKNIDDEDDGEDNYDQDQDED